MPVTSTGMTNSIDLRTFWIVLRSAKFRRSWRVLFEDDPLVRIVSVGRRRIRIRPRPRSWPPYPIALGGHALRVDAIVSRLQRAAGGVRIAGADGTAGDQAGAGAQRRPLPYMSRRRSDRRAGKRAARRANGRSSDRGLIGRCPGRLVADRLPRRTLAALIVPP